jgi:hypothetical protein
MSVYHRGHGWWYDRDNRVYHPIFDHTGDALQRPTLFRLTEEECKQFQGKDFEDVRDKVIPVVCARHFIRIRWVPRRGTLGWQFVGDPHDAREILRAWAPEMGVGEGAEVTFTDFSFGELFLPLGQLLTGDAAARFIESWAKSRGLSETPC